MSVRTGNPQTALEAVTWRRLLVSSWPWRSAGYLLATLPLALAAFAGLAIPWLVLVARLAAGDYQVGMIVGKRRDKPAWRRRWKSSASKG